MERTLEMTSVNANWDEFHKKNISEKLPFFTKDGRLYDCLFAQQLDRGLLTHLFETGMTIDMVATSGIFSEPIIMRNMATANR